MTGQAMLELAAMGAEPAVRIFDSPLPTFVEAELDRLYKSVFSSVARIRSMGLSEQVRAFVATRAG
jgi:thiamine monophosphate kinase